MPDDKRERWNKRYGETELVWSAGPNQRFADEVADLTPGTAVDLGAGEGRNAIWLAEQGWQVTAVDFSDVGMDKARRIAEKRGVTVNCVTADVTEVALPPAGFDLVALLYLHTTREERAQWLPMAVSLVSPGGTLIYIGHDRSNIEHGVGGPQVPEVLPVAAEITPLLAGFEVGFAGVIERQVAGEPGHQAPGAGGTALDCLVRARRVI